MIFFASLAAYKDLSHRKTAREIMWQEPAWGDCVANTGKIIQLFDIRALNLHRETGARNWVKKLSRAYVYI